MSPNALSNCKTIVFEGIVARGIHRVDSKEFYFGKSTLAQCNLAHEKLAHLMNRHTT